ncbi:MAG: Ig-like domain-containing protein [Isosphaeraceae bacterium]
MLGWTYLLDYNETVGDRAHDAVIRRATPTVALAASAAQVLPGQPLTFTANVGIPGGTAEGTVYFVDGTTVIGTAAIQGGQARFTTSTLGPGAHPIVAIYAHAQYGTAVSSPVNVAVNPVATTTRLAFTANSARTQLTFDAAVSAGSGTPSGVVLFYANGQLLQRVNVSNGHALMTVSSSSVLRKTVQAVFVPTGATYQGSGSPSVAITPQLISSSPIRAASTPTTVPSGPARRFVPRFRR